MYKRLFTSLLLASLLGAPMAYAGTLTPASPTAPTMYTLQDIYNRLFSNASTTAGSHSLSTTTSPAATFHTLTEIYSLIPTIDPTTVKTGTTILGVAGTFGGGGSSPANKRPVKTNQTTCYDGSNNPESCTGTGQDGDLKKGTVLSYTDNTDGTISDNSTGLMWMKCSQGLSGNTCSTGAATTFVWKDATSTCNSLVFAGHSDWRLPNVFELETINDFSIETPASINGTYFPNTVANGYWSSTPDIKYQDEPFVVDFSGGFVYTNFLTNVQPVRCVRTQASPASAAAAQPVNSGVVTCYNTNNPYLEISCSGTKQDGDTKTGATHSWTNNGDGTVTDNATGLMWEHCTRGYINSYCADVDPTYSPADSSWYGATTICAQSATGGFHDWRLPNVNELFSLTDYTLYPEGFAEAGGFNQTYFPSSGGKEYYTSDTQVDNPTTYFSVSDGIISDDQKAGAARYVRCVRN